MLYSPVKRCTEENYFDTYTEVTETNLKRIKEIEQKAIADGGLLHRFLYESVADGQAIYQIIKVGKRTVKVALCSIDGLYINYVVPQWGDLSTIKKDYAERSIRMQDAWREAINKNKGVR